MSTLKTTYLQHPSATNPNITLNADGTIFTPAGSILQVVYAEKLDTSSTTSSTFSDVSGMSATITPKSATSVILVRVTTSVQTADSANPNVAQFQIADGSNNIVYTTDTPGSRTQGFAVTGGSASAGYATVIGEMAHAPATTSAVTYKLRFRSTNNSTAVVVNRTGLDSNNASHLRGRSIITLTEIAG